MANDVEIRVGSRDNSKADLDALRGKLEALKRQRATVTVDVTDKEAVAKVARIDAQIAALGARTSRPSITVAGAAKAEAEIAAVDLSMSKLDKTFGDVADGAVQTGHDLGGLSNLAMPALVGAAVGLSPVIATLGVGLGGFGAAAIGTIGPVEKAAQATGGLRANMSSLDPEQRKVAQSLLGLSGEFGKFEKSLQPEVVRVFNDGIKIAGGLLGDVEPVAKATGKALDGMLVSVGQEFKSGEWQHFFTWMAQQAGPDVKLLTNSFVNLLQTLPPLLESLQPVATTILEVVADTTKLADTSANLEVQYEKLKNTSGGMSLSMSGVAKAAGQAAGQMVPGVKYAGQLKGWFDKLSGSADQASHAQGILAINTKSLRDGNANLIHPLGTVTGGLGVYRDKTVSATQATQQETQAVTSLTNSITKMLSPLLTAEQDQVTWKQAQQAATQAIKANTGSLDSNRASALQARAAIIDSTQKALAFAQAEQHQKGDIGAASTVLRDQIAYLEKHAGKSRVARAEIDALRSALRALPHNVTSNVHVNTPRKFIFAEKSGGTNNPIGELLVNQASTGARVAGYGGGDKHLYALEGGEAVVSKETTRAHAGELASWGVPGMARGGVAGMDRIPGLVGSAYAKDQAAALQADLRAAVAADIRRATTVNQAAKERALSNGPQSGALGGDAQANMALARHIFPWGESQWPPYVSLEMREAGFNRFARNPGSGAYGIPQALPPTKMPFAAQAAGGSHAGPQLSWQFGYIGGRYGNPANAWNHEVAYGWYDHGGWLQPGYTLAYNGTGKPEAVGGAGGPGNVTVVIGSTGNADFDSFMLKWVRNNVRIEGGGNVQAAFGRAS